MRNFMEAVVAIRFSWTGLDAGLVGFSVTYAFAVMGICQWTVIQSTKVETEVNANTCNKKTA